MWNILIVLVIAAVIWFYGGSALNLNPSQNSSTIKTVSTIKATDTKGQNSAVKSLTQDAVQEVNKAREIQQQEQEALGNQ